MYGHPNRTANIASHAAPTASEVRSTAPVPSIPYNKPTNGTASYGSAETAHNSSASSADKYKRVDSLRENPVYEAQPFTKEEEEMFSGTLKDGRNENSAAETADSEMISEKPILETIPPDISMKRCLDFLVPKVKSYEDLKECLELIGFSIRDSMFNANTSVNDFMNNTKNMQFKVINMDSWKSTSNLKGFDGLDYSLQSILDRIEDNSRSESVSVVKDLLDCRSMDEIDVMVDRVLAMAHVKDDIPVEENKDVPDVEFINSLNTDQLNHYINHFAQDDKSLKYAKKRLKKMNISKQKTTSRENRKPTRVREDRTV